MSACISLLLALFTGPVSLYAPPDSLASEVERFMSRHVVDGLVDYGSVVQDPSRLRLLTRTIADTDLADLSAPEIKAFYINSYNVLVISSVVEHYPIESPLEVDGFFSAIGHTVAGRTMTLDQLEKDTLLKEYPDPRLHFVLVCAARGCPPLMSAAFQSEKLDNQLDSRTKLALNDPRWVDPVREAERVLLSELFNWYADDFEDPIAFINRYRTESIPTAFEISFKPYDWSLNSLR